MGVIPASPPVVCLDPPALVRQARELVGDPFHPAVFVYGTSTILLRSDLCAALDRGGPPALVGFAVYLYAHELAHAAGVRDEAAADCRAGRSFVEVARLLGVRGWMVALRESLAWDGYDPLVFFNCLTVWPFGRFN